MQVKVRFKLTEQEAAHALELARHLHIDLDTFAKKSLIKTINELYELAEKMEREEKSDSDETQLTGGKLE
jgi:hypothetical protein